MREMYAVKTVLIFLSAFAALWLALPAHCFLSPPDFDKAEKSYKEGKYDEAFRDMKRLADSYPAAKRMLASMYWEGNGARKDIEKGAKLYQEAADAGDAEAQFALAGIYNQHIFGPDPAQDSKALDLYRKSAEQGLAAAQLRMGWLYFQGWENVGLRQDRDAAFEWFRKAARQGDPATEELLGNLLSEQSVNYEYDPAKRDMGKASELKQESLKWYLSAAGKGNAEAMTALAGLYAELGKPKLASYWAARCAEAARTVEEIRRMAALLSSMYRTGKGLQPDPAQAYKWLLIAASRGDESKEIIEDLRSRIPNDKLAEAEDAAKKWKPGDKIVLAQRPEKPRRQTPAQAPTQPVPTQAAAPAPAAPPAEQTAKLPPPLSPAFHLKEDPRALALLIGIENYRSAPAAKFAERDAAAVREYLRAMGYPERNIVYLTGADASLSGILSYLEEWLPKNAGPDSRLFIFYSGHGAPDPKTGEPYLVPWDGKLSYLKTTALPLARFYKDVGALKAGSILVAMDACFSGSGARSAIMEGARPLVVARSDAQDMPPNMAVLTSGSSGEISVMHEAAGHGLFTYHLLRAIDGLAGRAAPLTAGDVFDAAAAKVADEARRLNAEQTPVFRGDRAVPLY